jgi:hypothetical protein
MIAAVSSHAPAAQAGCSGVACASQRNVRATNNGNARDCTKSKRSSRSSAWTATARVGADSSTRSIGRAVCRASSIASMSARPRSRNAARTAASGEPSALRRTTNAPAFGSLLTSSAGTAGKKSSPAVRTTSVGSASTHSTPRSAFSAVTNVDGTVLETATRSGVRSGRIAVTFASAAAAVANATSTRPPRAGRSRNVKRVPRSLASIAAAVSSASSSVTRTSLVAAPCTTTARSTRSHAPDSASLTPSVETPRSAIGSRSAHGMRAIDVAAGASATRSAPIGVTPQTSIDVGPFAVANSSSTARSTLGGCASTRRDSMRRSNVANGSSAASASSGRAPASTIDVVSCGKRDARSRTAASAAAKRSPAIAADASTTSTCRVAFALDVRGSAHASQIAAAMPSTSAYASGWRNRCTNTRARVSSIASRQNSVVGTINARWRTRKRDSANSAAASASMPMVNAAPENVPKLMRGTSHQRTAARVAARPRRRRRVRASPRRARARTTSSSRRSAHARRDSARARAA